jgi:hypothetical protein
VQPNGNLCRAHAKRGTNYCGIHRLKIDNQIYAARMEAQRAEELIKLSEDKLVQVILTVKGIKIITDHEGYCSDGENEDIRLTETQRWLVTIPVKIFEGDYTNDNELTQALLAVGLKGYEEDNGGSGSGYCGESPSGRKHLTTFEIYKVKDMTTSNGGYDHEVTLQKF